MDPTNPPVKPGMATREQFLSALTAQQGQLAQKFPYQDNDQIVDFVNKMGPKYDWNGLQKYIQDPTSQQTLPPALYDTLRGAVEEHVYQQNTGKTGFRQYILDKVPFATGNMDPYFANLIITKKANQVNQDQSLLGVIGAGAELSAQTNILENSTNKYAITQFAHDFSGGLIPNKSPEQDWVAREASQSLLKPVIGLAAVGAQVATVEAGLGLLSKIPTSGAIAEQLGARTAEAVQATDAERAASMSSDIANNLGRYLTPTVRGAITGGIVNITGRPDGLDQDPSKIDLSGSASRWLEDRFGVNEKVALGVTGMAEFGLMQSVFHGIGVGLRYAGDIKVGTQASSDQIDAMRGLLQKAGVDVGDGATPIQVARMYRMNQGTIASTVATAGVMADRSSREEYLMSLMLDGQTYKPGSEDARLAAAILNHNPAGINIVKGVSDIDLIDKYVKTLGPNFFPMLVRRGSVSVPEAFALSSDQAREMSFNIAIYGIGNVPNDAVPFTVAGKNLDKVGDAQLITAASRIVGAQPFVNRAASEISLANATTPEAIQQVRRNLAKTIIAAANVDVDKVGAQIALTSEGMPIYHYGEYAGGPTDPAKSSTGIGGKLGPGLYFAIHPSDIAEKAPSLYEEFSRLRAPNPENALRQFRLSPDASILDLREGVDKTNFRQFTSVFEPNLQTRLLDLYEADKFKSWNDVREWFSEHPGVVSDEPQQWKAVFNNGLGSAGYDAVSLPGEMNVFRNAEKLVAPTERESDLFLGKATGSETKMIDQPLYDVLIARKNVTFDEARNLPRAIASKSTKLQNVLGSDDFKTSADHMFIDANGKAFEGSPEYDRIQKKLGIPPLKVNGIELPDVAVREGTGTISVKSTGGDALEVSIPNRITTAQARGLMKFVDRASPGSVRITNSAGTIQDLTKPSALQIEDALGQMTKSSRASVPLTSEMLDQYKRQGVFAGQAAIGANGIPYRIIRKMGAIYEVENPMRPGSSIKVNASKLQLLPTTLDGVSQSTKDFFGLLPPDEQQAWAKTTQAIENDLAKPVTSKADLDRVAGSFGFLTRAVGKGKYAISSVTAPTEEFLADGLDAAVEYVRKNARPAPDLTPPDLQRLLGDVTVPSPIATGAPPQFGQRVALNFDKITPELLEDARGPNVWNKFGQPVAAAMKSMEDRTGIPFFQMFNELQTNTVLKRNFTARWALGQGDTLPSGVMPLKKIVDDAGKDADQLAITKWLETPAEQRPELEATMKPTDVTAANRMKAWYDQMFQTFGVRADYLENYAPRFRDFASKYSNDVISSWQQGTGKSLPKGADFFADFIRTGAVDVYEERAFHAAVQYLKAGASERFMSQSLDKAGDFLQALNGRRDLQLPFSQYLESMRGFEFMDHKAALQETFRSVLGRLPGMSAENAKSLSVNLGDTLLSLGYTSTLAFRVPSALRNFFQLMQTTFPMTGMSGNRFAAAIGRAMTEEGYLDAVRAGAIDLKPQALPFRDELSDSADQILPGWFNKVADKGFKMYDNADNFTRAATFHAFKLQAQDAVDAFAKTAASTSVSAEDALTGLLHDSGAYQLDKGIQQEFIRRLGVNPQAAVDYMSKEATDVSQFLYGRGMQPAWMRSIFGKFLGQYGTWPLWYIDYMTRTARNISQFGSKVDLARFIARQAVVNGGVLAAGAYLGIDLSRWLAYPAMFYSGGPGVQMIGGLSQLMYGLGQKASFSDQGNPDQSMAEGVATMAQAASNFIPFRSFYRDMSRFGDATTLQEFAAAALGGQVSQRAKVGDLLNVFNYANEPLSSEEWMRYKRPGPGNPLTPQNRTARGYPGEVDNQPNTPLQGYGNVGLPQTSSRMTIKSPLLSPINPPSLPAPPSQTEPQPIKSF